MNDKSPILEGLVNQYRNYKKLLDQADSLVSQEELEGSDLERFREISKELKEDSFSPKLLKGEKEKIERVLRAYEDLELKVNPITSDEFYMIDKKRILSATTPEYRDFLKESGYAPNIDSAQGLMIAKNILQADDKVKRIIQNNNITAEVEDNTNYVVKINQPNARRLVETLGFKLLTTGLMYRLFIPYIKDLAQQGNAEAQATLNEMINTSTGKAEWLEDLILDKTRLKIGNQERRLVLPDKDGWFDRQDINELGYPTIVKDSGEFYHWHVSGDERAVIRIRFAGLVLNLNGDPSFVDGGLGVRCAKFFP